MAAWTVAWRDYKMAANWVGLWVFSMVDSLAGY